MQESEEIDDSDNDVKIFFDFEAMQETVIGENQFGPIFAHRPNLCVAMKVCKTCKEDVKKGEFGTCPAGCKQGKWIFKGPNCRDEFAEWLFSEENQSSLAIAHNSKAYDSQFLIQYLIKEGFCPKIITKGRELMMLEYCGIRVLDSLNFLPMALADLPKAFGETELKKGYFPHKFNRSEFQNYKVRILVHGL